jgi:hypothetical protein
MRRIITVMALLAACASAAPALAGSKTAPQIRDARGDWAVASQDVIDGTVTATAKTVQGDLHLAALPATGVHTQYAVVLTVGCKTYVLHYDWNGGLPGSSAAMDEYSCPTSGLPEELLSDQQATATYPATATVTAAGVRISAAPTKFLRSGIKVAAAATTRLANVIVVTGTTGNSTSIGGDLAYGDKAFVLGS